MRLRTKSAIRTRLGLFIPLLLVALGARPAQARVELQPCHNNIAPDQQVELGKKAVQQVYEQMPVLPDDSPVSRYVRALGQKLAAQAPGQHWPYNFHVVNVAEVNAFALPGGSIFVNLGAIQAADTEAQLAAVMAHEISHVVLQHSVCNLEKQKRVGLMAGIGQIASGLILGDSTIGALAQTGIGLTAGLSFLKMGREAEQQADLEGVGILYDAGYDPRAMPQFFEVIESKYGKGGAQFLSDHPNPGNRTEYVDREISTLEPRSNYVRNTSQFTDIHRTVAGMTAYTQKQVESGEWKRQGPNKTVSTGVNEYKPEQQPAPRPDATPQGWTTFQGNGFSFSVPANWGAAGDRNAAMVAPPGGVTSAASGQSGNMVYGLMTDVYRAAPNAGIRQQFSALVAELKRDNPGLQTEAARRVSLGSAKGQSAHSHNQAANGGRGEHDWIVAAATRDGLRYFVLVAPESEFEAMRPTYERVVNSIRLQ